MICLALNVAVPVPDILYTAVKVRLPGVRPESSTVTLARTGFEPATRREFVSKAALPSMLTDMKAVVFVLEPLSSPVRMMSTLPEDGTTASTDGPPPSVT